MRTAPSTSAQQRAAAALARFGGAEGGRSAAVVSLRGVALRVAHDADAVRPAASVLKLAVAGAALAAEREGALDLEAPIRCAELAEVDGPSVLGVLGADHELSLRELCGVALATSDNPAAEAVLRRVGGERVRRLLDGLGLTRTTLANGYDQRGVDDARRSTTTAAEALILARELIHGDREISRMLECSVRNTRIPLRLPEGTRAPHKTGSLRDVANDVGVVYGEQTDLAVAFLCEGQVDTARTSIAIGDCVAELRRAVGEAAEC